MMPFPLERRASKAEIFQLYQRLHKTIPEQFSCQGQQQPPN
ncbi:MAG: hypothetical protein AAF151_07700 [Cyanobacteria bacterium J06656_5]